MSTNIIDFFKGLSERLYKENDLSDLTYALCLASPPFRQFFLDFFFRGSIRLDGRNVEIIREWNDRRGNRPDFCIEDKTLGKCYIEVKIWDRKQHFVPYIQSIMKEEAINNEAKAASRIGYIAGYKITTREFPKSGIIKALRTWGEFYNELKLYDFLNDDVVRAYGVFLQNVCGIQSDLDTFCFKLSDFKQIRTFMSELTSNKQSDYIIYDRKSGFIRNCRMGTYFEIPKYHGSSVFGWIGAYYSGSHAEIVVDFEDKEGWGKPVCDYFGRTPREDGRTVWYYAPEGGHLFFYMTDADNGDVKKFFKRVLQEIKEPYKEQLAQPRERMTQKVSQQFECLLAMRKFPTIMEQEFFDVDGVEIECSSRDDSEDPNQWCGRYFTVNIPKESGAFRGEGWVGVLYDSDNPEFVIQKKGKQGYETVHKIPEASMKEMAKDFKAKICEIFEDC